MSKMYTDEILMAFADGKLDEPEFTEIALAIETDAALAERVEALATASRGAKAVMSSSLAMKTGIQDSTASPAIPSGG